ncbi:MAG: phospholipase, partial [Pseudomonadota bacterium]
VPASQSDIRPLLTQGGAFAYQNGGIVLNSTDHADRVSVAREVVPHAIAMVVHILNHAAEQL